MKMINSRINESMMQLMPRMKSRKEERMTRVSNNLQAKQTQMKHPSEIMNINEGGKERKFHHMEFKTDQAIRLQMVTGEDI